jgi:hypothetical protein
MLQKELDHTPTVKTDAAAAFLASLEDPKLTSLGETEKKPPIEILPPGMPPLSAPPIVIKKSGTKPGLPNAVKASNGPIGAPMVQGAPMAQGTPGAQGIPMNQVTPSQGSDEAKPLEATVVDAAPTTSEGTAAPAAAEGTAAPSSEEAKAAPGSEGGTSHPINEEATAVAVSDAPGSPDAAAAAALAPAADTSSSDAPAVTPSEVTVSPPSTDAPELTDKPSPTEASLPPPPSVSGV